MSRQHVPGAWHDLCGKLSAARSAIGAVDFYMPSTNLHADVIQDHLDSISDLAYAAFELLKLCKADCNALERALLDIPDPPPAGCGGAGAPDIPT